MPPRKKIVPTEGQQVSAVLTHEEALKRIAELEAALESQSEQKTVALPAMEEDMKRIRELESALMVSRRQATAARTLAATAADEPVYEVTNVIGAALSVEVTDHRGQPTRISWPERKAVQYLTASQILEIKDNYPRMFDNGYLIAPEVLPVPHNVIEDYDKFLNNISFDEIGQRVRSFTHADPLLSLFDHIEKKRIRTHDDSGAPILDGNGLPKVQVERLDAKTELVYNALISRVRELTGMQLSYDNEGAE